MIDPDKLKRGDVLIGPKYKKADYHYSPGKFFIVELVDLVPRWAKHIGLMEEDAIRQMCVRLKRIQWFPKEGARKAGFSEIGYEDIKKYSAHLKNFSHAEEDDVQQIREWLFLEGL